MIEPTHNRIRKSIVQDWIIVLFAGTSNDLLTTGRRIWQLSAGSIKGDMPSGTRSLFPLMHVPENDHRICTIYIFSTSTFFFAFVGLLKQIKLTNVIGKLQ